MAFIPANIGGGESSTPITPSNSSPVALTANTSVKPTTNGYAIASYDSVTPSSTPESVASGDIVKIGGSGVIVDSVPTPTNLTPSNSSPATITSGTLYSATANGKAVATVTDVTPSDSTPPSISSGDIIKSSASGYLYATQQSGGMTQTTLWTNSNTGTNFAGQTITLSQNMTDFDYIGIYYRGVRTSNPSIESEILVTPTNIAKSKNTANYPLATIGGVLSSGTYIIRMVMYSAANKLLISDAKAYGSSTTNNAVAFPLYVYGYKL